jgi:hypothetical protein
VSWAANDRQEAATELVDIRNLADCPEREAPMIIPSNLKAWLERTNLTPGGAPNHGWFEDTCRRSARALRFAKEEMERELQMIIREGYGEQHPEG